MSMNVSMLTSDRTHVSGKVTVGNSVIDVPTFEIEAGLCQTDREQLVMDKALELNPDLALAHASLSNSTPASNHTKKDDLI